MKSLLRVLLSGVLLASVVAPALGQDGDTLRGYYMEYLTNEGYRPQVDGDGDVLFKREGKTYFVDVHDGDPEFFMLVLPNIWPIESAEERTQVHLAADHTNREAKAVKVLTKGDDVWITVEIFVGEPMDFKAVFERCMSAIDTGVEQFVEKMRE